VDMEETVGYNAGEGSGDGVCALDTTLSASGLNVLRVKTNVEESDSES